MLLDYGILQPAAPRGRAKAASTDLVLVPASHTKNKMPQNMSNSKLTSVYIWLDLKRFHFEFSKKILWEHFLWKQIATNILNCLCKCWIIYCTDKVSLDPCNSVKKIVEFSHIKCLKWGSETRNNIVYVVSTVITSMLTDDFVLLLAAETVRMMDSCCPFASKKAPFAYARQL